MAKSEVVVHHIHFQCNSVTGWTEKRPNSPLWVYFAGQRIAYTALQGKLKTTCHSVMIQHNLISAWRG